MGGIETLDFTERDVKIKSPCGVFFAGPSKSGKSTLLQEVVEFSYEIFDPPPASKTYAYGQYDERVHEFQRLGATVIAGLPTEEYIDSLEKPALIILDDLMNVIKKEYAVKTYTVDVHHKNLIVITTAQNMYEKSLMVARMNSQYLIIMRSPSAALHIRTLGSQLFPMNLRYFLDAYHQATKKPYDYLVIDSYPTTPDALRLRNRLRPVEDTMVFLPKSL